MSLSKLEINDIVKKIKINFEKQLKTTKTAKKNLKKNLQLLAEESDNEPEEESEEEESEEKKLICEECESILIENNKCNKCKKIVCNKCINNNFLCYPCDLTFNIKISNIKIRKKYYCNGNDDIFWVFKKLTKNYLIISVLSKKAYFIDVRLTIYKNDNTKEDVLFTFDIIKKGSYILYQIYNVESIGIYIEDID